MVAAALQDPTPTNHSVLLFQAASGLLLSQIRGGPRKIDPPPYLVFSLELLPACLPASEGRSG